MSCQESLPHGQSEIKTKTRSAGWWTQQDDTYITPMNSAPNYPRRDSVRSRVSRPFDKVSLCYPERLLQLQTTLRRLFLLHGGWHSMRSSYRLYTVCSCARRREQSWWSVLQRDNTETEEDLYDILKSLSGRYMNVGYRSVEKGRSNMYIQLQRREVRDSLSRRPDVIKSGEIHARDRV